MASLYIFALTVIHTIQSDTVDLLLFHIHSSETREIFVCILCIKMDHFERKPRSAFRSLGELNWFLSKGTLLNVS